MQVGTATEFADQVHAALNGDGRRVSVATVSDVAAARATLSERDVDCLVVPMAPDGSDTNRVRALRRVADDRPLLVVAPRSAESAAAETLAAGATDYLLLDDGESATRATLQAGRLRRRVRLLVDASGDRPAKHDGDRRDDQHDESQDGDRPVGDRDRQLVAIESAMDGIAILEDEEYVYMNDAHAAVFGYDRDALVGESWRRLYDDATTAYLENEVFPELEREGEWRGKLVGTRQDGSAVHHEVTLSVAADDPDVHICTNRDITDRVERQRELRETKERLDLAVEGAELGVWDWDLETDAVRFNEQWAEMLGHSLDELDPHLQTWKERVHPDDRPNVTTALEAHLDGETDLYDTEHRLRTADGEWKWIRDVGRVVERAADGTPLRAVGIHQDITDRKRFEQTLRQLQAVGRTLLETTSVESVAEVAVEAAEDLLGLELTAVWRYDPVAEALVPIEETASSRALFGETPEFTPGDSLAWETFEAGESRVYDDLDSVSGIHNPRTEVRSEILVPLGDRGLMITGSTTERSFSQSDVDLFNILASTVEAALARAEREERLAEQNERLDEFASVVAHDLRNPLAIAKGFVDIAQETGNPDHLARVASAHARIDRLIDELLALAHGATTVEDPERLDLATVASDSWEYVDTRSATLVLPDELPVVAGDATRLKQLFENLFRNAVEHGGDDVTVEVGTLTGREGIYVADDGVGIDAECRDTVFEYGVSSTENGTGLGLAIVADVAEAHDWTVSVHEREDGGARFDFEF
jgi:PAS domain S-box-containing protein